VSIEYVRADVLRNVHGRLIERYGGVAGIRDENGLEAAIARPQQLAHYSQVEAIGVLGASLAWSLLRNHPFSDGDKRSAFAALTIFLDINGYRWTCSEVEETAMFLLAAGSGLKEEEFTAWIERSIAPQ